MSREPELGKDAERFVMEAKGEVLASCVVRDDGAEAVAAVV